MTPNSCECLRALRHFRRSVVRAPGAEIRDARNLAARASELRFLRLDELETRLDDRRRMELRDATGNHARDHRGRELPRGRQQPFAAMHFPLAVLVVLPDHARTHRVRPVVELLLQLVLDELAL